MRSGLPVGLMPPGRRGRAAIPCGAARARGWRPWTTRPTEYRFYGELATWWPLISPPEEYLEEAGFVAGVLARRNGRPRRPGARQRRRTQRCAPQAALHDDAGRPVGGDAGRLAPAQPGLRAPAGRHADGAPRSDLRRRLRPRRGGLHDDREDLRRRWTAFEHCRPGGVAVFVPDATAETFEESTDHGGRDGDDEGLPLAVSAISSGPGIRTRPTVGCRPSTASCCGTTTDRCGRCTSRTGRACSPRRRGAACSARPGSSRPRCSRRPARTARRAELFLARR